MFSGTCNVIKSASVNNSSKVFFDMAFPSGNFFNTSKKITFIPNDSDSTLTWLPICPYPIIPMVLPRISFDPSADFNQSPR